MSGEQGARLSKEMTSLAVRHTEFIDDSADEIARMARDRRLPPDQRRKAQAEEKGRKMRNRQKRESG